MSNITVLSELKSLLSSAHTGDFLLRAAYIYVARRQFAAAAGTIQYIFLGKNKAAAASIASKAFGRFLPRGMVVFCGAGSSI